MNQRPPQPADERAAERTIRDMMGLLALPSLWANRDGAGILQIMSEAVEHIVPIVFSYVHMPLLNEDRPVDLVRVRGLSVDGEAQNDWIAQATNIWAHRREADARLHRLDTPLGPMRVVRFSMSYGPFAGHVWFGSDHKDFPDVRHLAYLRAATSLAAAGLQAARATYEREQASLAKDEFLAMLGHELRNPLAPIVSALNIMALKSHGIVAPEQVILNRQVGHLRRLVDDLLDVSRITRGKIELKKEPVELTVLLRRAIEDSRTQFKERNHHFIEALGDKEAFVFGDATRLTQVFTNLLSNAAKYTDPGGTITLSLLIQDKAVDIQVRDNGSGISPRLFPKLFNIFEQGTSTIDRSGGGLGIGLAIVKSFVELHGGSVDAFSEGTGKGSRFTVTLPRLNSSTVSAPGLPMSLPDPAQTGRVLLVDDNIDALETLEYCLRLQGYEVATASDPLSALQLAATFAPAVAVLDIGLPVMDGYQLAAEFRKQYVTCCPRLIALTGYGQAADRDRASAAGFDLHLVKPVDLTELLQALSSNAAHLQSQQQS